MKRFFVSQKQLGFDTILEGGEHNHLAHVLRMESNERVILICGDIWDYVYEIVRITKSQTHLKFISRTRNKSNPNTNLVVFLGVNKLDNLALVVEKLNEIGVGEFVPFTGARSNIPKNALNQAKLQNIANQSCKQCGRSIPMRVHEAITFSDVLDELGKFDIAFYADRGECDSQIDVHILQGKQYTAIIIGPEGGFTANELISVKNSARQITLGSRILRSETAAIVASTVMLSMLGEL